MEELKCPICKIQYADTNPPRLLTMCGHTYCHQCIKTLIKSKDYRYQIRCPEDRLKLNLDTPTPSQFPKNMVLVQAMNRLNPRGEPCQDRNEFLMGMLSQSTGHSSKQSWRSSKKSSLLLTMRSSMDEGRCLLHQKALDIICVEEKMQICAECALFGVHKGHTCTTIKDLEGKRREWIHQLAEIVEERKLFEEKANWNPGGSCLKVLLESKRSELFDQINLRFRNLKEMLQLREFELKEQLQRELILLEEKLSHCPPMPSKTEDLFKEWELEVLNSMEHLQADDLLKQIAFFSDMLLSEEHNLVAKGRNVINQLKQEQQAAKAALQSQLEFPKLSYIENIQQQLRKAVQLIGLPSQIYQIAENRHQSKGSLDLRSTIQDYQTPQFEQISLLDVTDNFRCKTNQSNIIDSLNQSKILADNSFLPNLDSSYSVEIYPNTLKKVRSKDSLLNHSLTKPNDNRYVFNSPKHRKRTQIVSKGSIAPPSPVFLKNKVKRSLFKVKDQQKFQRLMKALEADSLQIADFTGLEMGDQTAKEVCDKLKNCKKVKSLRLMKNHLSDEILPELFQILPRLEIINLSQNTFSSKIFQFLERQARKDRSRTIKYLQLGQNNLNPRKCKQKIEELKHLGYIVSL